MQFKVEGKFYLFTKSILKSQNFLESMYGAIVRKLKKFK